MASKRPSDNTPAQSPTRKRTRVDSGTVNVLPAVTTNEDSVDTAADDLSSILYQAAIYARKLEAENKALHTQIEQERKDSKEACQSFRNEADAKEFQRNLLAGEKEVLEEQMKKLDREKKELEKGKKAVELEFKNLHGKYQMAETLCHELDKKLADVKKELAKEKESVTREKERVVKEKQRAAKVAEVLEKGKKDLESQLKELWES